MYKSCAKAIITAVRNEIDPCNKGLDGTTVWRSNQINAMHLPFSRLESYKHLFMVYGIKMKVIGDFVRFTM